MNGSMAGTSIQDLHMRQNMCSLNQMQQTQYGTMQNHQREQGHNAAHNVHQGQQSAYYDMENNHGYPQYLPRPTAETGFNSNMMKSAYPDIEDLARDISDNLPDDLPTRGLPVAARTPTPGAVASPASNDDGAGAGAEEGEGEEEKEHFGKSTVNSIMAPIPEKAREPLIIFLLFVLLSHPFVKNNLGKYIKQINPDDSGKVGLAGIVIYGLLLAVMFYLVKRFALRT